MPNLLNFDPNLFLGFIIIFARISGVMVAAPIFSDTNIPAQLKVGLTLIMSLVFYPIVAAPRVGPDPGLLQLVYLMGSELSIGLLIGFSARLLLVGVEMAGEVAGFQMGLGIVSIFDPSTQQQVSLIGQAMTLFATILFVALDGHHLFIASLARSYDLVGAGAINLTRPAFDHYTGVAGKLFLVGLQVGAPLVVALLAANFAMGLIARSVPQVNIFIVGFPFTIALGLIFLVIGFPFFIRTVAKILGELEGIIATGLKLLG